MPLNDSNDIRERPGFPGQIAECDLQNITSGMAEEDLLVGVFVASGVAPRGYILPAAAADVVGINVLPLGQEERSTTNAQDAEGRHFIPNESKVSVADFGSFYVFAEGAPARGGEVYVRVAVDGALDVIGGVAPAAGTGLELLPGAVFKGTASNGVAEVRYRTV